MSDKIIIEKAALESYSTQIVQLRERNKELNDALDRANRRANTAEGKMRLAEFQLEKFQEMLKALCGKEFENWHENDEGCF